MNRLAVSIHYYTPSTFTIISEDASWGKAQKTWGSKADLKELNNNLDKVQETFIDKGIPVIIGEYGATTTKKEYESVINYIYSVCQEVYERNMVPILWDTPGGFYNRTTYTFEEPKLLEMLMSVPEKDDE